MSQAQHSEQTPDDEILADLLDTLDIIADGLERQFLAGGPDAPTLEQITRVRETRAAAHQPAA